MKKNVFILTLSLFFLILSLFIIFNNNQSFDVKIQAEFENTSTDEINNNYAEKIKKINLFSV